MKNIFASIVRSNMFVKGELSYTSLIALPPHLLSSIFIFRFFNIPYMTQKDICYILPPFKFLQIKQRLFKRDEHKNLDKIFCPFLCLLRFFPLELSQKKFF